MVPSEDMVANEAPAAPGRFSSLRRFQQWLTPGRVLGLSALCALLAGAHVYLLQPVIYTSKASLLLNEQPDAISSLQAQIVAGSLGGMTGLGAITPTALQRFEPILRSRKFSNQLEKRYGLSKRYHVDAEEVHRQLRKSIALKTFGASGILSGATAVGMEIAVSCPAGPRLRVWLRQPVPFTVAEARKTSAAIANDALTFLDQYTAKSSVTQAQNTSQFLEKRVATVQERLDTTAGELTALQRDYRLLTPESRTDEISTQLKAVTEDYAGAQASIQEGQAALQKIRSRLPAETVTRTERAVLARNPAITQIETDQIALEAKLQSELSSGKLANHPDVRALREAIEANRKKRDSLAQSVQQQIDTGANPVYDALVQKQLEAEIATAAAVARGAIARRSLAALEQQLRALPPVARRYVELSRQVAMQTELLGTLTKRLEMARIEEQRQAGGKFQVLDEAQPPLRKSGPSTTRTAVMVFLLVGALLSLIYVHRLGLFDPVEEA